MKIDNHELQNTEVAVAAYDRECLLRVDEELLFNEFLPPAPARVLDLGVGNGRTTVPLHERGYHVTGIEYCQPLVDAALRRNPHVDIRWGDARHLDFADATIDAVIFSWNGIDYMDPYTERLKVLKEAYRVLKPGGIFLLSSHNAFGVIDRLRRPWGLTKRGLMFLYDQLVHGRQMRGWYCIWRDDSLGKPLFYSAPPRVQSANLRSAGWEVLRVSSVCTPKRPVRWWVDVHVNYTCRKPASPNPA